mmetsp:Transcript_28319/g.53948  ORF Transcript_28319/g.53948 Transcript_28319/m.53948 type:complete len:204 (-) Transcript_28319:688-1299(-)
MIQHRLRQLCLDPGLLLLQPAHLALHRLTVVLLLLHQLQHLLHRLLARHDLVSERCLRQLHRLDVLLRRLQRRCGGEHLLLQLKDVRAGLLLLLLQLARGGHQVLPRPLAQQQALLRQLQLPAGVLHRRTGAVALHGRHGGLGALPHRLLHQAGLLVHHVPHVLRRAQQFLLQPGHRRAQLTLDALRRLQLALQAGHLLGGDV